MATRSRGYPVNRRDFLKATLVGTGSALLPLLPGSSTPAGSAQADSPQKGGTLTIGHIAEVGSMDPQLSSPGYDHHLLYAVYDTLVSYGPDLVPKPGLAESWTQADPKTYLFKIRQGVKFHDGTVCNAAAVKFNLDQMLDPNWRSLWRGQMAGFIEKSEVVDDYTLKVTSPSANVALPGLLGDKMGMIKSPDAVKKYGNDYGVTAAAGTGPFKFVEWRAHDRVVVERNPNYWDRSLPYLDKLIFKIIPNGDVLVTSLRSGDIDVTYAVDFKQVDAIRKDANLNYVQGDSTAYWVLWMVKIPPFDNPAVRLAVNYAIDRRAILDMAAFGRGKIANGVITPAHKAFYDPSVPPLSRDLAAAKAKLQEAGLPNGFEFSAYVTDASTSLPSAQIVQASLAEVGIKMNLKPTDDSTMSKAVNTHSSLAVTLATGRPDIHNQISRAYGPGGATSGGLEDPQVATLLNQALAETDQAKRAQLYRNIEKRVREIGHHAPLIFPAYNMAMKKSVMGTQLYGDGKTRWHNVWLKK